MFETIITIIGAIMASVSAVWFTFLAVYSIARYKKFPIKDEDIIFVWEEVENKILKKSHNNCDNH